MKTHTNITGNKKAAIESDFVVIGKFCFDGQEPIRELSFLIVLKSIISKTLSTAVDLAVSIGVAVPSKMISHDCNQSIVSVIRGATPHTARQTELEPCFQGQRTQVSVY